MHRQTTFVVLNWNGGEATLACIQSALTQEGEAVECIVVDNASTDGSFEAIQRRYPHLKLLRNGTNLGFAAGMNRGIREATGDMIVPLNQDVVLSPQFAQRARVIADADSRVGAVGGVLYQMDHPDQIDAGGYLLRRRLAARVLEPPKEPVDVFGVSGACPVLKRSMLDDLALSPGEFFDSAYFAYFEDIDLFFRAQLRGWRVVYAADLVAWHHRSMSSGGGRRFYQKPTKIQWYHFRNRYLTLVKNCPATLAFDVVPAFLLSEILTWPYLAVRSPKSLAVLVRSWGGVLAALSRTWRQRRAIQARRTAPALSIRQFLTRI